MSEEIAIIAGIVGFAMCFHVGIEPIRLVCAVSECSTGRRHFPFTANIINMIKRVHVTRMFYYE